MRSKRNKNMFNDQRFIKVHNRVGQLLLSWSGNLWFRSYFNRFRDLVSIIFFRCPSPGFQGLLLWIMFSFLLFGFFTVWGKGGLNTVKLTMAFSYRCLVNKSFLMENSHLKQMHFKHTQLAWSPVVRFLMNYQILYVKKVFVSLWLIKIISSMSRWWFVTDTVGLTARQTLR